VLRYDYKASNHLSKLLNLLQRARPASAEGGLVSRDDSMVEVALGEYVLVDVGAVAYVSGVVRFPLPTNRAE
jgi:hypothetical protein